MNGFAELQQPILQALGMAVLHSCWQGLILFCCIRMVLHVVPGQKPVARYRIAYAALVLLFAGFLSSFFLEYRLAGIKPATFAAGNTLVAAHVGSGTWASVWLRVFTFRYTHLLQAYMPWIALCYTAGVGLLCGKMLRSLIQVRLLRQDVVLPDSGMLQQMERLQRLSGLKKPVLLRLSARVDVPVMLGYLKPLVLLPMSLVNRLDAQQMEAVLLHELAHIRRNDYLWNLLQMVMETFMFFNPAAWFLSRTIRLEREHCCDDRVVAITKTPLPYAHALLLLEEQRQPLNSAAMAATGAQKNSLLNRIKRMTSMKKETRNSQRTLATITAVVLIAAMACFATAFGQSNKKETKTKTEKHSYSKITVVDDEGKVKTWESHDGDTTGMADALKGVPDALDMAQKSIDNINWDEMNTTIEKSMAGASEAMKQIDWDDIQQKVNDAMKEARVSMKEIDWKAINAEMADARKEVAKAMEMAKVQMNEADWKEVDKAMEEARKEMKKARIIMRETLKEQRSQQSDNAEHAEPAMPEVTED